MNNRDSYWWNPEKIILYPFCLIEGDAQNRTVRRRRAVLLNRAGKSMIRQRIFMQTQGMHVGWWKKKCIFMPAVKWGQRNRPGQKKDVSFCDTIKTQHSLVVSAVSVRQCPWGMSHLCHDICVTGCHAANLQSSREANVWLWSIKGERGDESGKHIWSTAKVMPPSGHHLRVLPPPRATAF